MSAVRAHALASGEKEPRVEGYLVDLYESASYPVKLVEGAEAYLHDELTRVRKNYTLAGEAVDLRARNISAGEHCFSCAYWQHCDLGRELVLAFT